MDIRFDDGSRSVVYGSAEPPFSEDGNPRGAISAFVDITQMVEAEEALRRQERQISLILETAPLMIAHCDTHCRYRFGNARYHGVFGLEREEVMGRHIREVFGDDLFESAQPHITRVLNGETDDYELTALKPPMVAKASGSADYLPTAQRTARGLDHGT
ncbi:MAG: PAS domain-containing protein [Opitutales bacterium]